MLKLGTLRLKRGAAVAGLAVITTAFTYGCKEASFGGKEQGAQAKKRSSNPGENTTIDPKAYGTPATDALSKGGWAQGPTIKAQIDGLFTPSTPTVGGNGEGQNGSLLSDSSGVLWLPCDDNGQTATPLKSDFFAKEGAKVRVAGELCPTVKLTGDVNVLFVIDHSGSMEGAAAEGPNDKTSGGSCGRLRAAEALANKFKSMAEVNVRAGVVNFSTFARTAAGMAPLSQLPLNAGVFCGADLAGLTNYYAAFSEATSVLSKIQGKKIVYFISDGSPTLGLGDARTSGLQAAQALRQVPDVTLYALFVGYTSGTTTNPQGYLEQITGDPKAVRVTANAQELVQAASGLSQPLIEIKKEDIVAQLSSGKTSRAVKIERLEASKDSPNRYHWVTEPFELISEAGKPTRNQLDIKAATSLGTTVSSSSEITYHTTTP